MIEKASKYSFMKTPTKEVQVDMSYKGCEFTTFVAGEKQTESVITIINRKN
jgi:hypothetical protein